MAKFSPYPRREYGRIFRVWARRNLFLLAGLSLGMATVLGIETALLLIAVPDGPLRWWLVGVFQTAVLGIGLHLINTAFLAHERDALWQLRGAWGENATRDELRRARRRSLIWGWVDSIILAAGDLDHVVVTRSGGLLSIDSKWRSDGSDVAAMARSAGRARLRAQGVAQSLLRPERGGHRSKGHPVTVRPLVVVWGPAQHRIPDGYELDGIPFVGGRRLLDWLAALEGAPIAESAAKDIVQRLKTYRSTAWAARSAHADPAAAARQRVEPPNRSRS